MQKKMSPQRRATPCLRKASSRKETDRVMVQDDLPLKKQLTEAVGILAGLVERHALSK